MTQLSRVMEMQIVGAVRLSDVGDGFQMTRDELE